MKVFNLDTKGPREKCSRYWELCVGSCHAATALRADWQQQMERCRRDLGFRYVRFHGLFDDDMSVAVRPLLASRPVLCFSNIDKIFDFLLSIGMKPFVELGFMPECLASGGKTVFHYKGNTTPPKSYEDWSWLIRSFLEHVTERYGRGEVRQWFFEVWNEPNLGGPDSPAGFWAADREEYFRLYEVTARTVKEMDGAFRVGGPATSNNAWIPEFLQACRESGAPVDFVSTHQYPTDVVLGYGVEDSGNFSNPLDINDPEKLKALADRVRRGGAEELEKVQKEYTVFQSHLWEHVERGVLTDMARRANREAGGLPLYYTEWGSLAGLESDGPFGASFIAKTVMDNHGLADGYAFWTFSDIFEESGQNPSAFFGGFGLMTQQGIPKAPYRAFQLLHRLGEERYLAAFHEGTVDVWAFRSHGESAVQLLLVNHQSLLHPVEEEEITVRLDGMEFYTGAELVRVDEDHANALAEWRRLGEPVYLTQRQHAALEAASCPEQEPLSLKREKEGLSLTLLLPPQGTALVTVYE